MAKTRQTSIVGNKLTVNELLELLPEGYIERLACELEVDKWVRKLNASTIFKLVLYSMLKGY